MAILNIQQGDSCRITLILPIERMDRVQEIVCSIGKWFFRLSDNTLIPSVDINKFTIDLTSLMTQSIMSDLEVSVAIDYSDLGIKKTNKSENLIISISKNSNQFSNASTSELTSAIITVVINEDVISQSIELANYLKGEKGDPFTYSDFTQQQLESLIGANGTNGVDGTNGIDGNGIQNIALLSTVGLVKTYRINYTNGSHFDFSVSDGANGVNGTNGINGTNGTNGTNGLSAYEIAVQEGYAGTQSQWNNENRNLSYINSLILG